MNAVEIEHVTKTFGQHTAVDDLDLVVPSETVYGFIGPNGSGKTTTLRMIMRILHPDRGEIRVLGESVLTAANDHIAYLPEERGLYKTMKVCDILRFYAELKGHRDCRADIDAWLERMGLSEWANKKVQTLSKGMAQKVQFIATIIARPKLVLLDEPFSGLDPVNMEVLREAVLDLRKQGATVIFSTHDMGVAEKMCDFIFMIHKGKKVLDGTLDSIQDKYGSDTLRIVVEGGPRLDDLPGVLDVSNFGRMQELRLAQGADPQSILAHLLQRGRVQHFELTRPTLHEIFVRIAAPEAGRATAVRKVFIIARREYVAAVRTKAFVIGLLAMPLFMGGSILVQMLVEGVRDVTEKQFAIVDRTPNSGLLDRLQKQVDKYNAGVIDSKSGKQTKGKFKLISIPPSDPEAIDEQRFQLSEEVRQGKLFGFLDIGAKALTASPLTFDPRKPVPKGVDDQALIRYHANRPTFFDFSQLAQTTLSEAALEKRLQPLLKQDVPTEQLKTLTQPVLVISKGLLNRDSEGNIKDATEQSRVAGFLVPFALVMMMFMVIMSGATPLMQGIVEEKMQRIAEVLLGSVNPFQLMLGKLLGMTAVALTIGAVYLGGTAWAAGHFGFAEYVTPTLVLWFLLFQTLAVMMYGALFVAIGAACSDMKETQNLLLPVMLIACLPMFMIQNVIQEPHGPVATGMSFFPFATPMLMVARVSIPPGVALWQPLLGVAIVLATTVGCVWVAGRIFRVGILMQGKAARLGEMARWVFRG